MYVYNPARNGMSKTPSKHLYGKSGCVRADTYAFITQHTAQHSTIRTISSFESLSVLCCEHSIVYIKSWEEYICIYL